ncbi:tyrosinase cofactor [Streptomyces sp. NBC_00344]|uniref:tyrosinase cofactor n=1 Tax=Streptomyces sp. NBC_00344 TaxID=2975720 RepID=UPI002E231136
MKASTQNWSRARWRGCVPRREVLRALFAVGVVGGTAGALVPVVTADEGGVQAPARRLRNTFDEMYRGRRIHGGATAGYTEIMVDGRPLHMMRRADGSYLSMVDHYRSYPTPLAAARGAVDELGGAQLSPASMRQL